MEWSLVDLKNLVAEYNKTYFNDEIEKPIVIKWDYSSFKNVECTYATMQYKNKTHILRVNPILHDCSPELMKNTLVHELIHAWQDEWEDQSAKDYDPHKGKFIEWCQYLNSNFNFKFPIDELASKKEGKSLKRTIYSLYYVYKDFQAKDGNTHTVGLFIKVISAADIGRLKAHGLKVKHYLHPKGSSECERTEYVGKPITTFIDKQGYTHPVTVPLTPILKMSGESAPQFMHDIQYSGNKSFKAYIWWDFEFNFNDGIEK